MKIFVDTAPFIYLIEDHEKYANTLKKYFQQLYVNDSVIISSVISYTEFSVKPERENKQNLIIDFENFIEKLEIPLLEIKKFHAKKAYQLRAKYKFLKGMDSLQLGIAITENCERFLSNDAQLKKIKEIRVEMIDDIEYK